MISGFDATSPTDFRYNVPELGKYLSEEAFVAYKSRVEAALASVKAGKGLISHEVAEQTERASRQVRAAEVYDEEGRTNHDIIAQVNVIREGLEGEAKGSVHWPATSYDLVDTANAMRYLDAFENVIIPDMVALERAWIDTAKQYHDLLQIGRTHGQHAEPITYGFAIAWYVSRFGKRLVNVIGATNSLEGKFSGAVGAYNASSLFFDDPEQFEENVMDECGLIPAEISTQITQPEPTTDLAHYVVSAFSVIVDWADDMRHLMRPEIGEIGIPRDSPDVATSSTMAHKANPIGLENIKSLWEEVTPKMITMYMNQLSERQRDLTNSASQRYTPEIFMIFDYAVRRAIRIARNSKPHPENMRRNFEMSADKITAEPLQIMLSSLGHPDAHRYIADLSEQSYESDVPLTTLVMEDKSLQPYLEELTDEQKGILSDPQNYIGRASEKALAVANSWEQQLSGL